MTLTQFLLQSNFPIEVRKVFSVGGSDSFIQVVSAGLFNKSDGVITQSFISLHYYKSAIGMARLASADRITYEKDGDDLLVSNIESLVSPWFTDCAPTLTNRPTLINWSNLKIRGLLTQWFEERIEKII